jgi:hypothetical protein
VTTTGWETFGAIVKVNEELLAQERAQRPSTCPVDGHLLEDVRGVLHCVFGGELYDYTGKLLYNYQV